MESRSCRIFCPIAGCLHADDLNARGWNLHSATRPHLNEYCIGRFSGQVPQDYLDQHKLQLCSYCGQLVNRRFNACCPRCRPNLRDRNRVASQSLAQENADSLPSLEEIFSLQVRTVKYVPRGARDLWAQCLGRSLAKTVNDNSLSAWKELLMAAKCILSSPPRRGKKLKEQTLSIIRNRAQRWLNGERDSL